MRGTERIDRIWVSGSADLAELAREVVEAGSEVLELPLDEPHEAPAAGELVLLSPEGGEVNPFVLCSRLKGADPGAIGVVFVCREADREQVESIARFCMADGVLARDATRTTAELGEELRALLGRTMRRETVDVLLARAMNKIGEDERALAERVLSGLSSEREQSFVESVTDADTGLFDGRFMAFKLEEEFKRSSRFRMPLSVLLVDLPGLGNSGVDNSGVGDSGVGDSGVGDSGVERARLLGEVAGLFLNECRDIDLIGRYDDTSFLLLLPHTGPGGAKTMARRILGSLCAADGAREDLRPAVAIVTVPRRGLDRKDELLDLLRLTLVSAWTRDGSERVQVG